MIVAGLGYCKGVSVAQLEAALAEALRRAELGDAQVLQIAVAAQKAHEPAVQRLAEARQLSLIVIAQSELEAASPRTLTRSARSLQTMNVHSVAEAAALAAAGSAAQLLAPRLALGPVTCALARGDATP